MKKRLSLLLTSLAGMFILFSSCQKEMGAPKQNELMGTPLSTSGTYCRIESIWEKPNMPDQKFILILYDQYENPVAVTQPVVTTGHTYRTFKYDTWHRLREYRGEYANGLYEFWHLYGFDNAGRIGVDTTYIFGHLGERPTDFFERRISMIEYDSHNRISRISTISTITPPSVNTYEYDAWGNLVYPPAFGVTYDNKINFNRTNDIWMFLNRDYSMNNPFTANAYNSANYPTIINSPRNYSFLNEFEMNHSQIGYGCRPSPFF